MVLVPDHSVIRLSLSPGPLEGHPHPTPFPRLSAVFMNSVLSLQTPLSPNSHSLEAWSSNSLANSFLFFFFFVLGPHLWQMEVLRTRVESELQLLVYTLAMATLDPNCICDLHHNRQQGRILTTLSEARDRTCILRDSVGFLTH